METDCVSCEILNITQVIFRLQTDYTLLMRGLFTPTKGIHEMFNEEWQFYQNLKGHAISEC
jgi:hypothetical protein